MNPREELARIRVDLYPWIRHWDTLGDDDEPQPLPAGVASGLSAIVARFPTHEPALRDLLTVQLLTESRAAGMATLRRLIALPTKPKQAAEDKAQLARLAKLSSEAEIDPFLAKLPIARDQFLNLGKFVETEAERDSQCDLSTYRLTETWASTVAGFAGEAFNELRTRLFEAGAYNDFYVREIYYQLTE